MGADEFHPVSPNALIDRPLPPRPLSESLLPKGSPDLSCVESIVDNEPYPFAFSSTPPRTRAEFNGYRSNSKDKVNIFPSHDSPIAFSSSRPVAVTCAPCVSSACPPQFHPPIVSMAAQRLPSSFLSGHSSRSHSLPRANGNSISGVAVPYSPAMMTRNLDCEAHFNRSIELRNSPRSPRNEISERLHRASIGASIDTRSTPRQPFNSDSPSELPNRLVAIFDYNARTDEEISLRKGDSMLALNIR
ncbi:unnamed protein product [Rodentolepis nana]|uniref:SH3 domain-containing protein n=1 Tax=Rodentolepis nana TaxID=102285 RepID=A0A0R3TR99_RODNA|nr:unnamed protein product [Rodentolepis nana]